MPMAIRLSPAHVFLPLAVLLIGGGCGDGALNGGRSGRAGAEGGATGSGATAGTGVADASAGRGGTIGGGTATGGAPGVGGNAGNGGLGVGGGGAGGGTAVDGSAGTDGGTGAGGSAGTGGSGRVDGGAGSSATGGSGGRGGTGGAAGSGASGGNAGRGGSAGFGGNAGAGGASDAGGTDGSSTCTNPVFVTSDPNGGWNSGGYYVHNNMWNSSAGLGPETLYACAYNNWYVVSNQTNSAGAVKTYPNVHKNYNNTAISSFNAITSTFAETSPHVGVYNVAYDIWTNGIATSGSTEIMIWTENFNQRPAGSKTTTALFGGRTYDVWKTSDNHYIAFVPTVVFTSGTVDLLEMLRWTISQGWLAANSTLGQICFGVEIVSTNGSDATFYFTDFSITNN